MKRFTIALLFLCLLWCGLVVAMPQRNYTGFSPAHSDFIGKLADRAATAYRVDSFASFKRDRSRTRHHQTLRRLDRALQAAGYSAFPAQPRNIITFVVTYDSNEEVETITVDASVYGRSTPFTANEKDWLTDLAKTAEKRWLQTVSYTARITSARNRRNAALRRLQRALVASGRPNFGGTVANVNSLDVVKNPATGALISVHVRTP